MIKFKKGNYKGTFEKHWRYNDMCAESCKICTRFIDDHCNNFNISLPHYAYIGVYAIKKKEE